MIRIGTLLLVAMPLLWACPDPSPGEEKPSRPKAPKPPTEVMDAGSIVVSPQPDAGTNSPQQDGGFVMHPRVDSGSPATSEPDAGGIISPITDSGISETIEPDAGSLAPPANDAGHGQDSIPTTEEVYNGLFASCNGCHNYAGSATGFFDSLDDFETKMVADSLLVVPGDATNSELYRLLIGTGTGTFTQMPTYGDSFQTLSDNGQTDISIEAVMAWINALDVSTPPGNDGGVQPPVLDAGSSDETQIDGGQTMPPVTDGGIVFNANDDVFTRLKPDCMGCHMSGPKDFFKDLETFEAKLGVEI